MTQQQRIPWLVWQGLSRLRCNLQHLLHWSRQCGSQGKVQQYSHQRPMPKKQQQQTSAQQSLC